MQSALQTPSKKQWLKMVERIDDPFFCEALIVQLEARREQLQPDFKSHSPRGDVM